MFENRKFLAEFGLRALQEVSKSIPIPKPRPTAMDLEGSPKMTRNPGMKYEPSVRNSMTEPVGGDSVSKFNYARDPNAGTPNASMRGRIRAKFFG